MKDIRDKIIRKQDELIKFYGEIIDDNAMFLHIHHIDSSEEEIETGERLRSELASLKAELEKEEDEQLLSNKCKICGFPILRGEVFCYEHEPEYNEDDAYCD